MSLAKEKMQLIIFLKLIVFKEIYTIRFSTNNISFGCINIDCGFRFCCSKSQFKNYNNVFT